MTKTVTDKQIYGLLKELAGWDIEDAHHCQLAIADVRKWLAGLPGEPAAEQKYSEKDVSAITAAIDAVREEKSVTGVCVGGRATLGGNDIMLLKVPSGSYGIGVRYAIRAVNRGAERG